MADSNTETAAPTGGDGVQSGSEFSKPTGEGDGALWEKHFGKGSESGKKPSGERKSASGKSESGSRDAGDEPRKPSSRSTSEKDEKSSSPKESKSTKAESSDSSRAHEKTSGKSERGSSKDDDSEATGRKTAEEPADPEAPGKKARDLFAEAKKAEDPREARKLYKRAMKEAFGEVPEEFDDSRYAAVRKERKAATAAIEEKAKKVEGRIQEAADKLKPAIFVMRKLEEAKFAEHITVPMVEKTIHVMRALKSLEDGDYTQLAEVVSRAAGVDHDEAMKRFVRGVKVSPEGKAARQVAEQAQRENQALKERLQQLENKLTERETTQTEEQKRAEQDRRKTEARSRYLDDIQTDLADHPVLKLHRGAERVMAYLIRTADPKLRSARYSFEQAADKIVASEKRRLQGARHLLDDEAPPVRERERPRLTNVSRTETVDTGVRSESPEARFDYFFDKHAGEQRASGRRR